MVESGLWWARLVGGHETLEVGSVDHAAVDLELGEGIVNLDKL